MRYHEQDHLDDEYASAILPLIEGIIKESGRIDDPNDSKSLEIVFDVIHEYMRSYNFVAIQRAFDQLNVQILLTGVKPSPLETYLGVFYANEEPEKPCKYKLLPIYFEGNVAEYVLASLGYKREENFDRLRQTGRYGYVREGSTYLQQLHARDN